MPNTLRRAVRMMAPYASGETTGDMVQLGFNESGFPPSPRALEAAHLAAARARTYCDFDYGALRRALAHHYGLDCDRIVCGAGSMDIMGHLVHCCLEHGRALVTGHYGYSFPRTLAEAAGAEIILVDEDSFTHDVDEFLGAVTAHTAMVYIANPNNPTGTALPISDIRRLANGLPGHVLLMLDSAYADYATDEDYASGESLVDEGYNVVVLHTFSKIHGLAGMRVGWAYASRDVVDAIGKVRAPGIVSVQSLAAAIASLADTDHVLDVRNRTIDLRERFFVRLIELGLDPQPGNANFLLVGLPDGLGMDAEELYQRIRARGILLRRLANFGLERHLRITIGSPDDMEALDHALTDLLAGK